MTLRSNLAWASGVRGREGQEPDGGLAQGWSPWVGEGSVGEGLGTPFLSL